MCVRVEGSGARLHLGHGNQLSAGGPECSPMVFDLASGVIQVMADTEHSYAADINCTVIAVG